MRLPVAPCLPCVPCVPCVPLRAVPALYHMITSWPSLPQVRPSEMAGLKPHEWANCELLQPLISALCVAADSNFRGISSCLQSWRARNQHPEPQLRQEPKLRASRTPGARAGCQKATLRRTASCCSRSRRRSC